MRLVRLLYYIGNYIKTRASPLAYSILPSN